MLLSRTNSASQSLRPQICGGWFCVIVRVFAFILALLLPDFLSAQEATEITNQASVALTQGGQTSRVLSNTVRIPRRSGNVTFKLNKAANVTTIQPGQEITYTIAIARGGDGTPDGIPTVVDGQPQTLIVLRDAIPAQTQFVRFSSGVAAGGTLLFHRSGDPEHTYTTVQPAGTREIDAIAVGFVPEQLTRTRVRFTVRVEPSATGVLKNIAQIFVVDGPGQPATTTASNAVRLAVAPVQVSGGLVFDAKTGKPIEGATVTLVDAASGQPALVFGPDGATAPNNVLTGTDGRFSFPVIPSGSYRIVVLPPPGYQAPSRTGANALAGGHRIDQNASYGLVFTYDPSAGPLLWDVPCDPVTDAGAGLFVQKLASRQTAEIGDEVSYTINVKNVSGRELSDVIVDDVLPRGFVFQSGSARADTGARIRSNAGEGSSRQKFSIGSIADGKIASITYRAKVGPDAPNGDGINRAQASNQGQPRVKSNVAAAQVIVEAGVFTTRGIIFGKVFVDVNRNRIQDATEPGVPGVRLYLQDGSYVVTDGEGKYDFYGILPRTHVLKLDKITLPPGAELAVLDNRNAGTAGTRFVELKHAEMHKANFAIGNATPEIMAHIKVLREAASKIAGEGERALRGDLSRDGSSSTLIGGAGSDRRALPASGVIEPGMSVQPTQDTRNEGGGSLLLNDARMQFAPQVQRGNYAQPMVPNIPRPQGNAPIGSSSAHGANAIARPLVAPAAAATPALQAAPKTAERNSFQPVLPPAAEIVDHTGSISPVPPSSAMAEPSLPLPGEETNLALFDVQNPPAAAVVPSVPLPAAVATSTAKPASTEPGFLDLKDGDTLPMAQTTIRIQGRAGSQLQLKVNGETVPAHRVGKRVTDPAAGTEAVEYIGVALRPGANELAVGATDPFGNVRGGRTIKVIAPDKLGQVKIDLPAREQPADGRTAARIGVRLLDAAGVPVTARTELTLEASLGAWDVADLDPAAPGVQVFIEGGKAEFDLRSPIEPGDCRVRISAGVLRAEEMLAWLPDLRPMIAAGLVEGRVNFSNLSGNIMRSEKRDGFEQELRELSVSSGDTQAGVRAAFFLKGKVKGDYLLTAAYDSEREVRERLFRDIQPDEFYPVYGDSAVKGFEAQSTGPLYVRIDKKKSYLLYGDFTTQGNTSSDVRQLGAYNRSVTGVKQHFENSRVNANAWASYDSTRQIIEEVRANGTSGPYLFSIRSAGGLTNSEKVEVLIRSRNNPGQIIKTEGKTRFTDYEFEPFTGRILFKAPVPSLDADLNPVSIRVTYEAETGGPKFWTYGADAQVKVFDKLEVGGSFVREENPAQRFALYSANAVYEIAKNTFLMGEWARTEDEILGAGNAYRFELRHLSDNAAARIFWGHADEKFHNQSALLQSGRTEGGAQVAMKLGPNTRLLLEGVNTESSEGGARRGVVASVEQTFRGNIRLEIGGRWSRESGGPASLSSEAAGITENEVRSIRAKLSAPVPWTDDRARIFGEYEQDIFESDKRMAAIGGEYQVDPKTRLYARHELISTLGGPFELNSTQRQNNTVVGVESTYMKDAQLFNEYRLRDGISGRESESAIGLRNTWPLAPGLRAQTSFERVSPILLNPSGQVNAGPNSTGVKAQPIVLSETTAITGALEYTANPNWKGTARLELRQSDVSDSLLNTLGVAWKINPDLTALGKSIVYIADNKAPGAQDQRQFRLLAGMAYRPNNSDKWNALLKYEFKSEEGGLGNGGFAAAHSQAGATVDSNRRVHILSADINYQPTPDIFLSGHYAGKLADEDLGGHAGTTTAHMVAGRATWDVTRQFDVGLNASTLLSGDGMSYALGPEIGVTLRDNLRVGVGYNFLGYDDPDLSEGEYTQKGFYLALRFKFDEETFQRRKRKEASK